MSLENGYHKVCPTCKEEKVLKDFYKRHDECRACIHKRAWTIPLADKVEAYRQKKEVDKQIKSELKRIARKRAKDRLRNRKLAAQKRFIPTKPVDEVVVDPATKELARRELSRRRLIEFVQEFHPRYKAGWVHHDICARLEQFARDVAAGKSPRLMILMPPRHGKSQIASKLFPAWLLGHYNYFEVIACSYNVSLALEFSREVRAVVRSERYTKLFPNTQINTEAQAAEGWKLLSPTGVGAGGYVAAGIGGPITGKGAHVLIIDDPIKNLEEAESAEMREKIWGWYTSTAYTRLAPGGGVLVIQTCWHDDDLSGRLQTLMKEDPEADQYVVVKYPAIAIEDEQFRVEGDALHPDRYDADALRRIKNTLSPRQWASLYQQDPVPDEGAYFTKDMFHMRKQAVDMTHCHLYQAWDFAISEKKVNDWNVGVTIALDPQDVAHVVEVRRFRTKDSAKIVDEMLDMYVTYSDRGKDRGGVQVVAAEDGQIWRTMQSILQKRMAEMRVYPTYEVQKPLTDKQVRARPLQGRMQQGRVTFPLSAGWMEPVRKELLRFPAGVNDDIVDALSWAVTMIISKQPPRAPGPPTGRKDKTVLEKLRAFARVGTGSHMAS